MKREILISKIEEIGCYLRIKKFKYEVWTNESTNRSSIISYSDKNFREAAIRRICNDLGINPNQILS